MAPLLEIEDVIENANLSVHQELNTIKSKAQLGHRAEDLSSKLRRVLREEMVLCQEV